MSKLSRIKLELSKLIASFSEIATDGATLYWTSDEEIAVGLEVYVVDENDVYVEAPDGEYRLDDGRVVVVANGVVAEIRDNNEDTATADAEEAAAEDNAVAAEDNEAVVDENEAVVESPSGEEEPVPDAIEELRKEVNELYEIVQRVIEKVADIENRVSETDSVVEKMSKMSAAFSAEEQIEKSASTAKTSNKNFDAALEAIKAARKNY